MPSTIALTRDCDTIFNENNGKVIWTSNSVLAYATHEAGHFVGVDDLNCEEFPSCDTEDSLEVMYSPNNRLWWGDAMGLRHIYYYDRVAPFSVGDDNQGLGADAAGIGGSVSQADIVFAWADNPSGDNRIRWAVGFDISLTDGSVTSWGTTYQSSWVIGHETSGVGAALALINSGTTNDLIVAWVDDPAGANTIRYRVGLDMSTSGSILSWSTAKTVPGWVGDNTYGLGAATASIGGSSRPDLVLFWKDSAWGDMYYKIGWDLSTLGNAASWTNAIDAGWDAPILQTAEVGVGLDIADVDGNGLLDMVVSTFVGSLLPAHTAIRIGWDVGASGSVAGWSRDFQVTRFSGVMGTPRGIGLALASFGPSPGKMAMMTTGISLIGFGADQMRYIWA